MGTKEASSLQYIIVLLRAGQLVKARITIVKDKECDLSSRYLWNPEKNGS